MRRQTKRDGQATAEGLDQPTPVMGLPQGSQVRHLPTLAARPLERRTQRGDLLGNRRHCRASVTERCVRRGQATAEPAVEQQQDGFRRR
jgi:hypothetical protein